MFLSHDQIQATDPDSDDMMVTFLLERDPYEGVVKRGGERAVNFTQSDLMAGLVLYQHTGEYFMMSFRLVTSRPNQTNLWCVPIT